MKPAPPVTKIRDMKKNPFKLRSGNNPSMAKLAGVSEKRIAEIRKKLKEDIGADGYDMSEKEHQSLVLELKKFMIKEQEDKKNKNK